MEHAHWKIRNTILDQNVICFIPFGSNLLYILCYIYTVVNITVQLQKLRDMLYIADWIIINTCSSERGTEMRVTSVQSVIDELYCTTCYTSLSWNKLEFSLSSLVLGILTIIIPEE